jgi:replication factor A1
MYKLPITITDDTGSIDVIAFSLIAQDLVERSAYHASQNMKIEATDHVVALQKAIGKTRLFHIGMSTNNSSNFSIRYVLRKCFEVNDSTTNSQVQNP